MFFDNLFADFARYYPQNRTVFGLDILPLQKPAKLSNQEVIQVLESTDRKEQAELVQAYKLARRVDQTTKIMGTGMVAFVGIGVYIKSFKGQPIQGIMVAAPVMLGQLAWVFHESWYGNTYSRRIRPIVDRIYDEMLDNLKQPALTSASTEKDFEEYKPKILDYYPKKATFFGWKMFGLANTKVFNANPEVTLLPEELQEILDNATFDQKAEIVKAYKEAEDEIFKSRAVVMAVTAPTAFFNGLRNWKMDGRLGHSTYSLLITGLFMTAYSFHASYYEGSYGNMLRPVVDKAHEKQQEEKERMKNQVIEVLKIQEVPAQKHGWFW